MGKPPPSSTSGISVGFSTTNKWASAVIRAVTRAPCSHAWLAFNDKTLDMRLVMQAESWGFEVRPWKRWIKENKIVAEFLPIGPPLDKSLKWIATYLGARYDFKAAALVGFWRLFGRWIKGKFSDPSRLMCSEGVIRFLQYGGYTSVRWLDPETTSPGLLLKILLSSGEFRRLSATPKILKRFGVNRE